MSTRPLDYAPLSAWRPTRRQVRAAFLSLLGSLLVLFLLFDIGCGLERRSILWPSIDTVYARGYSEEAFQRVRVEMTRRQVDAIMCKPLWAMTLSADGRSYVHAGAGGTPDAGFLRYEYTSDGGCPWGDFAWFGREVIFQDGVVVEVFSEMYYD